MIELSCIVSVPPRDVWEHEALKFTPWLAWPEKTSLRAEALSLREVEVEAYPEMHSWMLDCVKRMRAVFTERVKQLNLAADGTAEDA